METEMRQLVMRALAVMADPSCASDDDVAQALVGQGVDEVAAAKLVALVPLAFGRVLIASLGDVRTSSDFVVRSGETSTTRPLSSEPIFVHAFEVASEMMHAGPRHLFEAAATRGPELDAVNQALGSGVSLDGASLSSPIVWGAGW